MSVFSGIVAKIIAKSRALAIVCVKASFVSITCSNTVEPLYYGHLVASNPAIPAFFACGRKKAGMAGFETKHLGDLGEERCPHFKGTFILLVCLCVCVCVRM